MTDFSGMGQKLPTGHGQELLQPLYPVGHGEAFDNLLFQALGGPDMEAGGDNALYPVADGNYCIEIIKFSFSLNLAFSFDLNL